MSFDIKKIKSNIYSDSKSGIVPIKILQHKFYATLFLSILIG